MENIDTSQNKSLADLFKEAFWFVAHTFFAVLVLAAVVLGIALTHPDQDAMQPKLLCTALAFFVPFIVGFCIAKYQQNSIARYVWISGLLTFSVVCVWVLDLPTGPGLCDRCGLVERLYRTFFIINGNSGLMGGDGILIGSWVPLSMISYAFGAKYGLNDK